MSMQLEAERRENGRFLETQSAKVFSEELEPIVAVYEGLRRAARSLLQRKGRDENSLGPTGLVHEAAIRLLLDSNVREHRDRGYVFRAAIRAMGRILVERARKRHRLKRGGNWRRVPLDLDLDYFEEQKIDVSGLEEAIEGLSRWAGRQADVVRMRYFARMKIDEIAGHLGVSVSTVESDLTFARAWLRRELMGCGERS